MIYPAGFQDYCAAIEHRLTSLRKSVLFILWRPGRPMKAYDILNQLQQIKQNSKPPTVYRVLDYLTACGLVHKIESIQSYTLCHDPEKHQPSEILMVCNVCHRVHETFNSALREQIQHLSQQHDFHLGLDAIELKGLCQMCRVPNQTA